MWRDRIEDATTQPLRDALREVRPGLVAVAGVSFFLNLLAFAPALYMMSGFDRVVASRNPVTWAFLTGLLVVLGIAYAALSGLRSRALVRIGVAFDGHVGERLFEAVGSAMIQRGAGAGGPVTPVQAMRDLDVVRDTFAGRLVVAATDLLFAPLFLAGCVLLHPLIGLAALVAMGLLGLLGIVMNRASAPWTLRAMAAHVSAAEFAGTILRNAETIRALGMTGPLQLRWKRLRDAGLDWGASAADAGSWAGGGVAFLTVVGSTLVSAVALLLVVENLATTSVLFGAMILSGKALAPMASLAGNWKSYLAARYAFQRIERIFAGHAAPPEPMPLPRPQGRLSLEAVTAGPPGGDRPVLHDVSLAVEPGQIVGIVGPSGSGKTCLARVVTGVWPAWAGAVRLDGAELHHWAPDDLGRVMGYLPQEVELFPGTVAENIARFTAADAESIVEAARRAGVHALIQSLPDGYNTVVGDRAGNLSGGQRQRIALARALFGTPPVLVLDEPNASLDARGEESLVAAMKDAAASGAAVLLVTHRSNIMAHVDRMIVLSEGRVQTAGPRDEVLERLGVRSMPRLRTAGGRRHDAAAAAPAT